MIPQDLQEEYPFQSRYLQLESGHNLHYVDEFPEGKDDSEEAIVMLHGNPTWSFYYRNLIKQFSQTKRVIVPDHIGCGLSQKPSDYDYCLKNHISNVEQLLSFCGIKKVHLIVHDWGGAIGMGVATRDPNRIQSAVILNTAAFRSKQIPKSIALCKIPFLGEQIVRALNGFAWPATFMAVSKSLDHHAKKGLLWPYRNYSDRRAVARFVKDIPMKKTHPSYKTLEEIEKGLKNITAKKLILWGEDDFCFDMNFYNKWKEIYPQAQSKVYSGVGHYILEDAKDYIGAEIQEFYQSL